MQVVLIGSEPDKMTRLRRTYASLKKLGYTVRVLVPYQSPRGRPRVLTGMIRYILLMIQVALTRADVYHVFNVPDIIGLPVTFKRRAVFVYDVRSPWFSSVRESLGIEPLWRLAGLIERLLTLRATFVLTANTPLAIRARGWGAKRVVVIPNYPPESFRPSVSREEIRRRLGLSNEPTVLYLGKISRLEGVSLIKRVISETCSAIPDAKFLIVGDGPERDSLVRYVQDRGLSERVLFVGWIPHSIVPDYILAADICLLPRLQTSFSAYTTPENILKVNEYLAIGRPVVASKMGGFTDVQFPVIAVEPVYMGQAVIDFLKRPKTVELSHRLTWAVSEARLVDVYSQIQDRLR